MDKLYELHDFEFEWDEQKYAANIWRHNVKFEEAAEVFFDRFYILGDASVKEEQRDYLVGFSYSSKMLFVVYVERGVRMRIISARPATSHERKDYDEQF
jgi:uncharacterized protein